MLPTMRRSIIITFGSFAFFGVAYLFLMRITDGDPQLDAAANAHLNIRLAFAAINWSAQIAFLIIVFGGSPLLFIAIKQAIVRRHGNPLALFAIRPKLMLTLVALTILIEVGFFAFIIAAQAIASAPSKPVNLAVIQPPLVVLQLGIVTLFTFILVAGTVLPSLAILRSDFGMRILHYALILIGLTTITMAISLIATISWIVSMWIDAPQIADNLGLGPAGLRGNIGGSEGVVIVVVMMALAAALTAFALKRGLSSRAPVLA